MKMNLIRNHLCVELENFEEIRKLSIKLTPGMRQRNKIGCSEIMIPSEKILPENHFAYNKGVYIFRSNGNVYLYRKMPLAYGFKNPFIMSSEYLFCEENDGNFYQTSAYVPMAEGETFLDPNIQKIWDERKVLSSTFT